MLQIREKLVKEHTEVLGQEMVFDGLILYLPFPLAQKEILLNGVNPHSGVTVQMKVKRTCALPPGAPVHHAVQFGQQEVRLLC